ncbi:SigB/SigF/SigG family RNA polymerase sigma factor [Krasilnikovia sp. M28-CT-15]|uniref:SigB/SigF/SigG family RNA polymerase sigma factor n=1 Tax=Krasilnikovia sp. M28-CT-15 TaxID=3373540 RepID=UPI003876CB0B
MTAATSAARREQAAPSSTDEPGRRQPRPHAGATTSTPDTHLLGASRARPDALLAGLHGLAAGDAGRAAARAQVIDWYLPMSVYLARRFGGRGEPLADLTQVAAIGLIKAVDRYDPARGVPFASYAIPTIVGEIKRHFRDAGWTVRVPRRLQELRPRLAAAAGDLAQVLHRSPTTQELAARLGVSRDDVVEAQRCGTAYRPRSLEQPVTGAEDLRLIDTLYGTEYGLDAVDRRETLRWALALLPARERHVIGLRFVGDMTQAQIAAQIGVSQMHVSRLLTRSLSRLRHAIQADDADVVHGAGRTGLTCQVVGAGPSDGR